MPLAAAPQGCVHGVLHRISKVDWLKVQLSEGVGSQSAGYQVSQLLISLIPTYLLHVCFSCSHAQPCFCCPMVASNKGFDIS
jgi:hypothetical protein